MNGPDHGAQGMIEVEHVGALGRRMSNHVAYGLLAYTMLIIFLVSPQVHTQGLSLAPFFLLVLLVAMIMPVLHHIEKKWRPVDGDAGVSPGYRRDLAIIWLIALAVPLAIYAMLRMS